jgi:predicted transcriptional regulator of viral defense system
LKHIPPEKIFGTKTTWRGKSRVAVSDLHRTMVDILDDPTIGGGIRQVADCLTEYLKRADRDDDRLVDYAEKLGNGAVFKRLGFLVEFDPGAIHLAEACRARLTAGNAKLDPALYCPRLVSRWRLWIPPRWAARAS